MKILYLLPIMRIYDSYYFVNLTDSLRYTGSIHSLLKQVLATDDMKKGWIYGIDFNPGTRVVGEKPQFICVKDCNAMKDKVHELLRKLNEKGIQRNEIAVIKIGVSKDVIRDILLNDWKSKYL